MDNSGSPTASAVRENDLNSPYSPNRPDAIHGQAHNNSRRPSNNKHVQNSKEPFTTPTTDEIDPAAKHAQRADTMLINRVVNFSWENLTYKVPVEDDDGNITYKTLLHSMSGTALGGRVLAIMGPSGAGKTTLMGTITGKLYNPEAKLDGCCFLNNTIYSQRYKKLVSYVAQDDIVMGKDTPKEAIEFACRVRLGYSRKEAQERAAEVLKHLHLEKCQNTLLGIPGEIKGVSGGEKKRTSIGTELITNPHVLVLDEPTTGLDSVNAARVGELIQELARNDQRTVICTVHSPSSDLFEMFDDILLLARGHTIYHGPRVDAVGYFASHGYQVPHLTNPCEYYMNVLQLPDKELEVLWTAWEDYVASPSADSNPCLAVVGEHVNRSDEYLENCLEAKSVSLAVQFDALLVRSARMFMRDPRNFVGRTLQTIFFSVFYGLFFFNLKLDQQGVQDRSGILYIALMNNFMNAAMNGIASFPPERAVFLNEQANDAYSAAVYFTAKNIAEAPFQIILPTLYTLIVYFMAHLHRSAGAFFVFWFISVLLGNLGYAFGLMFATFFREATMAFAMVPIIMLPLFVVAGLFANTSRLEPYWIWLNYLSFARHAYLGVFTNEFSRLKVICDPVTPACRYASGDVVIQQQGFQSWHYWQTFISLIVYQMGLRVIGALSLHIQGVQRRGKLRFERNLETRVPSPRTATSKKDAGDEECKGH